MAFDLNLFIQDITDGVAVDKQALASILSNPAVAKRLEESTLRQADYSKVQTEYQKKIAAAQDYWDGLVAWDKKAKLELEQEKAKYRGDGSPSGDPAASQPQAVSKEELNKLTQDFLQYNAVSNKIAMQHLKEFGEVLDLNDVQRTSSENGGINITLAYEKLIQPKREEINKKAMETAIATARAEGAAEALKNVNMPSNEGPFQIANTQLDSLMKKPEDRSAYGSMAAIQAWRDAKAKGPINTAF